MMNLEYATINIGNIGELYGHTGKRNIAGFYKIIFLRYVI
jgi:hypothetical protein